MKGIENQRPPPSRDRRLVHFPGFSTQQFPSSIPYLLSSFSLSTAPLSLSRTTFLIHLAH